MAAVTGPGKMAGVRVVVATPRVFGPSGTLGGAERYAVSSAAAAAAADPGLRVELLGVAADPAAPAEGVVHGVPFRTVAATGRAHHWQDTLSLGLLGALDGADVVHVHQAFTRFGQATVTLAALAGAAVALTDHGGPTLPPFQQAELARLADLQIAYSDFGRSLLPPGPALTIPGGVDLDRFSPPPTTPDRRRFLVVGRVLPHKGVERVIAALPAGAGLTIVGPAEDPEYLGVVQAAAAGRDVIVRTDADDGELAQLYRSAIATVLASRYVDHLGRRYVAPELMGLVLLEAKACGTPVVASNVGALPEYVEHDVDGLIFRDDAELAEHLGRLAADPQLVERLGAGARATVAHHGLEPVGQALAAAYRRLDEGRGRGARS